MSNSTATKINTSDDSKQESVAKLPDVSNILECLEQRELKVFNTRFYNFEDLNNYTIFSNLPMEKRKELITSFNHIPLINRSIGCMVGMGIGDWVGTPLEFINVMKFMNKPNKRPQAHISKNEVRYFLPFNKFQLLAGQWTDDTSMGLCIADSLILNKYYDGSDIRTRFWTWWVLGYNNSNRKHPKKSNSVGLGGNISKSIFSMVADQKPTPRFEANTEDSGNGSLMRLAPIPIFYSSNLQLAYKYARESSFSTHPGNIAAEACAFQTHLIVRALTLKENPSDNVVAFLDMVIKEYDEILEKSMVQLQQEINTTTGNKKKQLQSKCSSQQLIRNLIASNQPEDSTERCWNWRSDFATFQTSILQTLRNRGSRYNGYPVDASYFGAYSMDGLSMALHSVYSTTSFGEAISRCVNLLGDADTTGSICGQLAGAIYGYQHIIQHNPVFMEKLNMWDDHEIALRAVILCSLGQTINQ